MSSILINCHEDAERRILDDVYPNSFINSDGMTVEGNAYWFASDKEVKFILEFDFTTERFGSLRQLG